MALRLRGWFGSRTDEERARPDAAVARGAAGSGPQADGGTLAGALRREVDARLLTLEESLGADRSRGCAPALLADLRGDIRTVVRRPSGAIQRALEACRDPDAPLDRIAATFAHDPALAQALLKYANSSFYASAGIGCTSLADAAQRIGQSGLHSVLMASLVESLLAQPGGKLGMMVQQVWTHLVRSAPLARRIGMVAKQPPEQCYTLGLLHDFGKLIVLDRLAALMAADGHGPGVSDEFLARALRELHGPLGGLAVLNWGLDDGSARAVAAHERAALRFEPDVLGEVLCVAEWADLTEIRDRPRDYEALWARAGLTLPLEACRDVLEDGAPRGA